MSDESNPLAKWSTGNLLGGLGFVSLVVTAWFNLDSRVVILETLERAETKEESQAQELIRQNNEILKKLAEKELAK